MRLILKNIGFASLLILAVYSNTSAQAPTPKSQTPQGWHMLDKSTDGFYGIGIEKAYKELLKGRKSNPLIVAVIDSGVDTVHQDLTPVLWRNSLEIPGNGIDDDNNGYIDDVYGWNFLGGKDGRNVGKDTHESERVYHASKDKFTYTAGKDTSSWATDPTYADWLRAKKEVVKPSGVDPRFAEFKTAYASLQKADVVLKGLMNKESFTGVELEAFIPTTPEGTSARQSFLDLMKENSMKESTNTKFLQDLGSYLASEEQKEQAANNPLEAIRANIVKDNYADFNDRSYGNNDVMASTSMHGTHVSGIIGAKRDNGLGMDGIADNIQIMTIRAVADGDEHDKDVALAIRYAVDNGARVINMSFGKAYSPEKHWVDDAVKYAAAKGVLLVHAAGNSKKDLDKEYNFPNPELAETKTRAKNYISVGASGDPTTGGLTANFSNYGKDRVDVFAPGVQIYSTLPGGDKFGDLSGTSMAAPVVSGIAALLFQYYPGLNAEQVKELIEQSAIAPEMEVSIPGTPGKTAKLSEISRTGGIVNAYEAIKLADQKYGKKKKYKKVPKQWRIKNSK